MKSLCSRVVLSLVIPVCLSATVFAETLQKPHSVTKSLQQNKNQTPTRSGGAHGSHNPHGKLSPEMHIQVALRHKAEGRMGVAFQSLDEAIALNPLSAELLAVRGSFYLEKNNISRALRDFEAALKISPDSAAILTNRAQAYRHFGRISEAIADLDKAISLQPGLMAAHFNRGAINYSSGDYTDALKDFDACVALEPHAAGPYFNRASTRDALGDRQGAIKDLQRFLEITGNSSWKKTAQQLLEKWQNTPTEKKLEKADS